jgi:thiamine monophosphate kinase
MTNIIKFQSPFERLKDNNKNPEITLIKAIILQSIIDATNISDCKEARRNEIDAKAWLYGGSEDFELLCEYINYNMNNVRKIARNIEKIHKESRLENRQKKNKIIKKQYKTHQNIIEKLLYSKMKVYL